MSEKFRGKFRTASHRLKNFDYASDGAYFITIVTQNRKIFFGEIIDNKMLCVMPEKLNIDDKNQKIFYISGKIIKYENVHINRK